MALSDEAKGKMKEIRALENKYGLMAFRMSLTHLVDVGHRHFDDDSIEEGFKLILDEEKAEQAGGKKSFMTPDFKREVLRCSVELSKFTILTLFAYIKKYFVVDI